MTDKMSMGGVGPRFAALSISYGLATAIISRHFAPFFRIDIGFYWIFQIVGVLLILIGIPFLIIAVFTVIPAHHADKLVTNGIYKFCRHPVYAAWVVFIVPGIVLMVKSWLGLTVPFAMYLITHILVKKEEIYLEQRFGSEYLSYRKKTLAILPVGCIKQDRYQN